MNEIKEIEKNRFDSLSDKEKEEIFSEFVKIFVTDKVKREEREKMVLIDKMKIITRGKNIVIDNLISV